MRATYFGATDKGLVRHNNEDNFFVQPVMGGGFLAACVIDGVGGYEGGEIAAQIAADVLLQYLQVPSGAAPTMLQEAMIAANDKIVAAKTARPDLADMACVATLALIDETANLLHYIHVGDTRLYLFRDGSLVKISRDQSFVGFLEDSGRLTEAEAMQHLKRNEIDKALGFDGQLRQTKDYFDSGSSPFLPGDLLLLCSDGLTDLVTAASITQVLQSDASLKTRTHALIDAANAAGGKDNITVVLVQHGRQPEKHKAVKPKKKPGRKPKPANPAPTATAPVQAPTAPIQTNAPKQKRKWLPFAVLLPVIALSAWLIWNSTNKKPDTQPVGTSTEAARLAALIGGANDSLVVDSTFGATTVLLGEALAIGQDSLAIRGNGLRLLADTGFDGAAMVLSPANRYLLLQDMVLEKFQIGILAQGQTVAVKNVHFLDCVVPVQYGQAAPVNSPVNVWIKDSIFRSADTNSR